jgi:hypothetical protein
MKSQRAFWMQVQGASRIWTFQSPLTLEMGITRAQFQSMSEGEFILYNISAEARSDIYQDWNSQGQYRQVTLRAGYRSWVSVPGAPNDQGQQTLQSLPLIFQGNITKAASHRQGPNWVTNIAAWDGGFAVNNSYISTPLEAGTTTEQQFTTLIAAMKPHVTLGYIDPTLNVQNLTGVSFDGSPWEKITEMARNLYASAFIDLEKVYIVSMANPVIPSLTGGLTIITPETGLLDTPEKQQTIVAFPMVFEPRLKVGQLVTLQSIETVNNGNYPIVGLDHTGMISDAVGGDLRTRVYCYYYPAYTTNGAIQ